MNTSDLIKERRKELQMTMKEVANAVGVSEATVSRWETGNIANMGRDKIASLSKVLKLSPSVIAGYSDTDDFSKFSNAVVLDNYHIYNTPIFESVSAGFGVSAQSNVVGYIPLPYKSKEAADNSLCIVVKGDSMTPKIENGDLIQVQKQSSVDNGEIAVVLLDGDEGFVKKIIYGDDYIKLISLNLNYPPIELKGESVKRCRVVGKVNKVIRDL